MAKTKTIIHRVVIEIPDDTFAKIVALEAKQPYWPITQMSILRKVKKEMATDMSNATGRPEPPERKTGSARRMLRRFLALFR